MLVTVYNSLKVLKLKQLRQLAREFGFSVSSRQNKDRIIQQLLLRPYQKAGGLIENEIAEPEIADLNENEIAEPEWNENENEIAEPELNENEIAEPEWNENENEIAEPEWYENENADESEIAEPELNEVAESTGSDFEPEPETSAEIERLQRVFKQEVLEKIYAKTGLDILKLAEAFPSLRPRIIEYLLKTHIRHNSDIISQKILFGHYDEVSSLVWKFDGTQLVSGSYDGTIRIWDLNSEQSKIFYKNDNQIYNIAWNSDGSNLAANISYITKQQYEVAQQKSLVRVWEFASKTQQSAFRLNDIETQQSAFRLNVSSMAWNSEGTKLALGCQNGDVMIYIHAFRSTFGIYEQNDSPINVVAWDPHNTHRLAIGSSDPAIIIFEVLPCGSAACAAEVIKNKPIKIELPDGNSRADSLAWHPIERDILAIGCSYGIIIWQVKKSESLFYLEIGVAVIRPLTWDSTGTRLAFVMARWNPNLIKDNDSQLIRIWRPNITSSVSSKSSKSKSMVSMSESVSVLETLSGHKGTINTLSWNPIMGSNQLASGSDDGTIQIWEISK